MSRELTFIRGGYKGTNSLLFGDTVLLDPILRRSRAIGSFTHKMSRGVESKLALPTQNFTVSCWVATILIPMALLHPTPCDLIGIWPPPDSSKSGSTYRFHHVFGPQTSNQILYAELEPMLRDSKTDIRYILLVGSV